MFQNHQDRQIVMRTKVNIRNFLLALNAFARHSQNRMKWRDRESISRLRFYFLDFIE
jgi:hypothetical protein